MNRSECAKVLAKIQLGDNRQVDQLVLDEWFDTIGHLNFEDAIAGVRLHRQESTAYLMAAHVIANAGRVRRDRLPLTALESAGRECAVHVGYPLPCHRCQEEGT
ncbi:hypothetical protein Agsp01_11700 [Agromyces sp. NBRC 114283]|nr:hypothetical protein Agsp01_11700 [Agromyces sp. NBRC 114283]